MSHTDANESPVESGDTSVTYDPDERRIGLERKPGEQPVTVAGGALGPTVDAGDDDVESSDPKSD